MNHEIKYSDIYHITEPSSEQQVLQALAGSYCRANVTSVKCPLIQSRCTVEKWREIVCLQVHTADHIVERLDLPSDLVTIL